MLCELQFVIEVFRHCARSPVHIQDPFNFGSEWDIGPGQCTRAGERQHYLSGLKRRKEYIEDLNFLPDIYTPGTIYAESTDYNRTQMSGYAHLLGMYPFEKRRQYVISSDSKYPELENYTVTQYIPLHVGTAGRGLLDGYNSKTCHANAVTQAQSLEQSNAEFANVTFIREMIQELNEKIDFSNQKEFPKHYRFKNFSDIQGFVDSYFAINFENKEHDVVMSSNFIMHMKEYFKYEHFHTIYRSLYGTQISNHHFFNMLIMLISKHAGIDTEVKPTNVTKSIPMDAKYYVLSAHDTTLTSLLSGLKNKENDFPVYASSLIIELHKDDSNGNFYVTFLYNGKNLKVNNRCNHHGQ